MAIKVIFIFCCLGWFAFAIETPKPKYSKDTIETVNAIRRATPGMKCEYADRDAFSSKPQPNHASPPFCDVWIDCKAPGVVGMSENIRCKSVGGKCPAANDCYNTFELQGIEEAATPPSQVKRARAGSR